MGKTIVVASYTRPVAAHLARMRLEAAGIQAALLDEAFAAMGYPDVSPVRIMVQEQDAARAREILGQESA